MSKQNKKSLKIEALAGLTAGCVTTFAVHPLDLIKVRLQVNTASRKSNSALYEIIKDLTSSNQIRRELYRGLIPNLAGNALGWGAYFFGYEMIKGQLIAARGSNNLTSLDYLLGAGISGIAASLLTNPIWVVKTRMLSTNSTHEGAYSGLLHGFSMLYRTEGLRGFYRGFIMSLFAVTNGAIQLMVYDEMKSIYLKSSSEEKGDKVLSSFQYLLFSSSSKITASLITYPTQVVRSRLQTYNADREYVSIRKALWRILKEEGISGFYKGLTLNLIRVVPATSITFLTYENTRKYLLTL
ncbi:mitochondrial carrier domain-containing protein [Dipodascopsis uninucleata]